MKKTIRPVKSVPNDLGEDRYQKDSEVCTDATKTQSEVHALTEDRLQRRRSYFGKVRFKCAQEISHLIIKTVEIRN